MSTNSWAYLADQQIPLKDAKIGIMTHALHYGTAVFEGIRGNWNSKQNKMYVFRLKEHYERLIRGSKILRINLPYTPEDYCNITIDLLKKNNFHEDVYIRPIAFKGAEMVANLKLHELSDEFALIILPFGSYIDNDRPIRCQTSSWRRPDDTIMPTGVKITGLYTTSILAKTEAVTAGYDEAILLNNDGTVSEGSGENLFIVNDGVITTPCETDNCLLGITRDSVIKLAKDYLNIKVIQRRIHRSELYLADEIFLTGTAAHITSVGELDNRTISDGNVGKFTKKLQDLYFSTVVGENPDYIKWCTSV